MGSIEDCGAAAVERALCKTKKLCSDEGASAPEKEAPVLVLSSWGLWGFCSGWKVS